MRRGTATSPIRAYRAGGFSDTDDVLAVEEPLELRIGHDSSGEASTLSVMMRTPGHDRELVAGWLWAEGLLEAVDGLETDPDTPNVVILRGDSERLRGAARATLTSAACGVCGSGSVERLSIRAAPALWTAGALDPELILTLPEQLGRAQPGFAATGGLHAAGLFTPDGGLLCAFEDVGRHNAVDKVVGWAARRSELPLTDRVLVTSSRAGFEIVQKAALAGVAVTVTVGAASSLAADTAGALGLTLVGFVRAGRFNVHAGAQRVGRG
ncbi:formate dehydrogenase accessory sulfurtransferase FdhD [Deinococcus alpinitundrae]|uniref:formate dehydrogenase accessory sulfurtransferase FdhD n=1 Tax=Deinococcus alpinitundrae TaxID=468913 RepID=UPI001ED91099|nr:formate dehydrogenase accessory sulfurtransferase FdhD [Deinococcus alpinitundrae]